MVVVGYVGRLGYVVAGAWVTAPPLLLFDRIRTPSAIARPAPTHKSNGGLSRLSPCASFTPATPPGARGPVSADIAGNGAMAIVALTENRNKRSFHPQLPFFGLFCYYILTINKIDGQLTSPSPPMRGPLDTQQPISRLYPDVFEEIINRCTDQEWIFKTSAR